MCNKIEKENISILIRKKTNNFIQKKDLSFSRVWVVYSRCYYLRKIMTLTDDNNKI